RTPDCRSQRASGSPHKITRTPFAMLAVASPSRKRDVPEISCKVPTSPLDSWFEVLNRLHNYRSGSLNEQQPLEAFFHDVPGHLRLGRLAAFAWALLEGTGLRRRLAAAIDLRNLQSGRPCRHVLRQPVRRPAFLRRAVSGFQHARRRRIHSRPEMDDRLLAVFCADAHPFAVLRA